MFKKGEPRIKTPRRLRYPRAVYRRAEELLNDPGFRSYKAISDQLHEEYTEAPSERSLSEWESKGWISRDERFAPWSMLKATPTEAGLVLPAVRFLIEQTGNVDQRPSNAIAEWIVKIRTVRPDLPMADVLTASFLAQSDAGNVRAVEAFLVGAIEAPAIGLRVSKEGGQHG